MISYQGRLLQNGVAYNGNISITFGLYNVPTGGTVWYSETQMVSVQNGLFNVMLGGYNPLRYQTEKFSRQQWLGILPFGAASELTPRQLLSTVGYEYGLMPETSVYDNNPSFSGAVPYNYSFYVSSQNHPGIYGGSAYASSVGVTGYSSGVSGIGVAGNTSYTNSIGVKGSSTGYNGIGIYGYVNNSPDVNTSAAIWGEMDSSGVAIRGNKEVNSGAGMGVEGTNYGSGSGSAGKASNYIGV